MIDDQLPTAGFVPHKKSSNQRVLLTTHISTYEVGRQVRIVIGQNENEMYTPQLRVIIHKGIVSCSLLQWFIGRGEFHL